MGYPRERSVPKLLDEPSTIKMPVTACPIVDRHEVIGYVGRGWFAAA